MLSSLVVVFAGFALAWPANAFPHGSQRAPFERRNETTDFQLAPLSETLRVNGQRVSPEDYVPNTHFDKREVEDVYTYAVKYRNTLENPTDITPRQNGIDIPIDPSSSSPQQRLHVDYTSRLKTCSISMPKLVSSLPTWYCNSGDKCQKAVKLSTVQTDVENGGYKVSVSVKGKTKFGPIETEVTIGGEYNKGWSKTTATTIEVTDTWTILYGQVCTPTSYQFSVLCDADIQVQSLKMLDVDGTEKKGTPENICNFFGDKNDRKEFVRGQGFSNEIADMVNDICASSSKTDGHGRINIDLKTQVLAPSPVTIQGCNF